MNSEPHAKWEESLLHRAGEAIECWLPIEKGSNVLPKVHLAVMREPFLTLLLSGTKTIESRFSKRPIPPYESVSKGDIVLLKATPGQVIGACLVSDCWFYEVDCHGLAEIRKSFWRAIGASDDEFWNSRAKCAYASLLTVSDVKRVGPIPCGKSDRRGWVILNGT